MFHFIFVKFNCIEHGLAWTQWGYLLRNKQHFSAKEKVHISIEHAPK